MRSALNDLPAAVRRQLDNVEFVLRRAPSPRDRKRLGLGNSMLYGLYEGVPLTQRGSGYDRVLAGPHHALLGPAGAQLSPRTPNWQDEVRKTLYHEIAHYFGMDEDELHDTSVR